MTAEPKGLTDEQHAQKIRDAISVLSYAIADAEKVGLTVRPLVREDDRQTIGADIVRKL